MKVYALIITVFHDYYKFILPVAHYDLGRKRAKQVVYCTDNQQITLTAKRFRMNNLRANYERILEVLRKISTERQLPVQRRRPALSDLELISLSLTAEYMGIDSENDLFRKLPPCLLGKIDHTVYNRRKRRLMPYQNAIRMDLAESFNLSEDVFIVDSMPLEVCKIARSSRSKICKEELHSMPSKGTVLHRRCIIMAINFMRYVRCKVFFRQLTLLQQMCTTFVICMISAISCWIVHYWAIRDTCPQRYN